MRTWAIGACRQITRWTPERDILINILIHVFYKVASVKYKKESLACPQIKLFNSSTFAGENKFPNDPFIL